MLTLLMRTDHQTAELYLYQDNSCLLQHSWTADRMLAESIHKEIDQFLKKANKRLNQLEGIGVYSGPGSFTSLRIGHSVANALTYGLNLPIVQAKGPIWQQRVVDMLGQSKNERVVIPTYGAPARTTLPRK